VAELIDQARARGGRAFSIPAGGSTSVGALGYVRAALELVEQTRAQGIHLDRILVATSTAGTLAGLVVGLAAIGAGTIVEGVAVSRTAAITTETARDLAGRVADLVAVPAPAQELIRVLDGYLGPGYGQPTEASREALELCARLEGLLLDPVYTAKAMAGLIDGVRARRIPASENVLFWHTGGTPALFAG
jgi:1-aminocyclopropane-1-carboxylate deaminase/D-cysteine desulfhydrase-like pyridoxal-dependent ACC family enzyme